MKGIKNWADLGFIGANCRFKVNIMGEKQNIVGRQSKWTGLAEGTNYNLQRFYPKGFQPLFTLPTKKKA